jgi:hypothetical protein
MINQIPEKHFVTNERLIHHDGRKINLSDPGGPRKRPEIVTFAPDNGLSPESGPEQ